MLLLLFPGVIVIAQENRQLTIGKPDAIVDLKTAEASSLVNAKWFVQGAQVTDADFKAPGPGSNGDKLPLYPTGASIKTHTIHPQISAAWQPPNNSS